MQNPPDKKPHLLRATIAAAVLLAVALLYGQYWRAQPAIKIGVLHSLSGALAASEAPLVDAVRLAVEEINQAGGVNGQAIEMLVADCRSDDAYCAQQAEKLIVQDKAQALFGCWTSNCRKAVKAVVEKHRHLLFYPLQYEGLELSPDIVYTGATPNQQIVPMVLWAMQHKGKRFYLIGSDGLFSRTASRIAKDILRAQGGQLAGERQVLPGASDMAEAVREIAAQRPDFVLNMLSGASNLDFFRALREAGMTAENIPVFSSRIAEAELAAIGPALVAGHYAAWSYFQSVDSAENKAFVARFRQRFGQERVLGDPMEAAYIGVMLWADSVRNADAADLLLVKNALVHQSMAAPQGIVAVDSDTGHLWKTVRIGRARPDGQFDIVWQSAAAVQPAPFPFYRSRQEWLAEPQAGAAQ